MKKILFIITIFCYNAFCEEIHTLSDLQSNKAIIKADGEIDYTLLNNQEEENFGDFSSLEEYKSQIYNDNFFSKKTQINASKIQFNKTEWNSINGINNENWFSVAFYYKNVCYKFFNQNSDDTLKSNTIAIGKIEDYKKICNEINNLTNESDAKNYFITNFIPYKIYDKKNSSNTGLFTGYYYPTLNASRTKTEKYKYPIYKKPPELSYKKYYTRKEINNGAIANRNLEIFWVDDFVDLYYLHIQGSGMLEMENGEIIHIKYAAKNNQPYTSVGKYMLEKEFVKSESDIKNFLHNNDNLANDILGVNKSYIFFEENHTENVIGSHGSYLVDGRSLAVDSNYIPYGAFLFLESPNYTKVMFAQDSGSAINGPIRGDIFIGKGHSAGQIAKQTHFQGILYIMIHKDHDISLL